MTNQLLPLGKDSLRSLAFPLHQVALADAGTKDAPFSDNTQVYDACFKCNWSVGTNPEIFEIALGEALNVEITDKRSYLRALVDAASIDQVKPIAPGRPFVFGDLEASPLTAL